MDEMINALQAAGAFVLEMSRIDNGFDLLAICPRGNYILRLDNGPLTAFEALVKAGVEASGSAYYIVRSPQEAIDLVRGSVQVTIEIIEHGARHELFDCKIDC